MKIGICGAHRCGKTTLAKKIAERSDIDFIEFGASYFFKKRNLTPTSKMSLMERLDIQNELLYHFEEIADSNESFVTDRTPADFLAYMMFEINTESLTGLGSNEVSKIMSYLTHCKASCSKHLDLGIFVRPGIQIVHEEMKAVTNQLAIDKLDTIVNTVIDYPACTTPFYKIDHEILDLDIRTELSLLAIRAAKDNRLG